MNDWEDLDDREYLAEKIRLIHDIEQAQADIREMKRKIEKMKQIQKLSDYLGESENGDSR